MAHTPRIHWPQPLRPGQTVQLQGERAHHLLRVMKRRPGDDLILFSPPDTEFDARITSVSKLALDLEILCARKVFRESSLNSVLVQAIARGDRMDYSIQKAVELGVSAIQPVLSQRSGVQLDGKRLARKQEHWQAIALSAAEQSGRTRIPEVFPCQRLQAWLDSQTRYGFVLCPATGSTLDTAPAQNTPVHLLVGPEGGLSDEEVSQSQRCGLQPLQLGPRILRTETAGVVALSLLQSCWGDL